MTIGQVFLAFLADIKHVQQLYYDLTSFS